MKKISRIEVEKLINKYTYDIDGCYVTANENGMNYELLIYIYNQEEYREKHLTFTKIADEIKDVINISVQIKTNY